MNFIKERYPVTVPMKENKSKLPLYSIKDIKKLVSCKDLDSWGRNPGMYPGMYISLNVHCWPLVKVSDVFDAAHLFKLYPADHAC